MSTAANRRAALGWIAQTLRHYPIQANMHGVDGYAIATEVARVIIAMESAAAVVDDPGVAEHVDGEPPPAPCRDAACECHASRAVIATNGTGATNGTQGGGWEP